MRYYSDVAVCLTKTVESSLKLLSLKSERVSSLIFNPL